MLDNDSINKNGRLKREDVTGAIEDIANSLIETINLLKSSIGEEKKPGIIDSLGSQIEEIEKQVFGDIRFTPVKLHKLLRACAEKP